MPVEPWKINADDSRKEDSIATYIIFCEDGYHEPAYFKSFEIEHQLKINTVPRQGSSNQNFFNAVIKCKEDGLIEFTNGKDKIKEGVTQNIWCVYDRDENINQPNTKEKDDFDFNIAIKNATDAGLKVAWSNDSFELWVLLHFTLPPSDAKLHHNKIYSELTRLFQNLTNQSDELINITETESFRYERNLKPQFTRHVIPLLKERIVVALENAFTLEALYTHAIPYHDCKPCTMVHHLVQELLNYQN
jgi:hypothetical protein